MKVKKTDLPVIPSEPEILPSLDDEADEADEDDDDDNDEEEDMMADEAVETEDDDDYESDEDLDDRDQDEDDSWDSLSTPQSKAVQKESGTTTTTTTTTAAPITTQKVTEMPSSSSSASPDPYFTHFDPRAEHQSYKVKVRILRSYVVRAIQKKIILIQNQDAQQRLEETHREKVTRVMKDWSDLEEKYQDMRLADPKSAQTFKQRMTARFQVCTLMSYCRQDTKRNCTLLEMT